MILVSFGDGNTALMVVAFLVAFNVPLAAYWLFWKGRGEDEADDTPDATSTEDS